MTQRQERDREDLLADATALIERIELSSPGFDEHIVVGFRSTGAGSVFFGQSECYQFNSAGELRRAFVDGRLYKAESRQLIALERQRSASEVALVQHELTPVETNDLTAAMAQQLNRLRTALSTQQVSIIGQVPADADVASRVQSWLEALPVPPVIAMRPHAL